MEKNFITEVPKTRIYKSRDGWTGDTLVKVKGICYEISTSKHSNGVISSSAQEVTDEGGGSVSFVMFQSKNYKLLSERAICNENKIKALHAEALTKFEQMTDELPSKDETDELKPGQVIFLNGYGQDEYDHERELVYKVEGKTVWYVNEKTLALGQHSLNTIRDIEEKFGIGMYFKKGDTVDMDIVNNLVIDATEKAAKDEAERPAREAAAKAERDAERAEIEAQYPYLEKVGEHSGGGKHVAVNLRIELKRQFPGVKFGITSSYSSCNIRWTDGPTKDQVQAITSKYEDHVTDFTGDYRDYSPSIFNNVFGGCNYVSEHRDWSAETEAILISWAYDPECEDPRGESRANELFRNLAIPLSAWEIVYEDKTDEWKAQLLDEETPEPQPAEICDNSGMVVRRNEEKDGIEISFPAKPDDAIIEMLKMTGFRWSRFAKVWWAKYTDDLWQFANSISAIMAD